MTILSRSVAPATPVARARLAEIVRTVARRPDPSGRALSAGTVRSFGAAYAHDVRNDSARPAISVHQYSPPLLTMRRYEVASGGVLRAAGEEREW